MKKFLAVMLLTIMTGFTLLMGCSNNNTFSKTGTEAQNVSKNVYPENGLPKDQQVTLKYGYFQGGLGREWVDAAIKAFTEKYPNVKIEITASPDIAQVLATKISAGNDADMFDIFNRQPAGGVVKLAHAGKLEPLDDIWVSKLLDKPDKTVKDMLMDGLYASAERIDGKSYEIPTSASVGGLFFNKKLFEKYHWNQNPQTWSEFTQLLADIKKDGITPITFPGMYPSYHDWAFGDVESFELADMKGNAGRYMKDYQQYKGPVFTNAENLDRWNRIYELGKKGYFDAGLAALTHTQSQMEILQGQVAMVSTGSHVENEMKNSTPKDFEWGYMSVPFVDSKDQKNWVHQGTTNGHYIWAAKPELNKKWAKEFIKFMFTLDVQELAAEKGGALPVRKDYTDDKQRYAKLQSSSKSVLDYLKNNNVYLVHAYRSVAISNPAFDQANKVRDEAVVNIFLGKQDPKPILEKAEGLMQQALKETK